MGFPITSDEQYAFALKVCCPWKDCQARVGERCKPGLIFPQYPHTSRLTAGFVHENFQEGIEAMQELERSLEAGCSCDSCRARDELLRLQAEKESRNELAN